MEVKADDRLLDPKILRPTPLFAAWQDWAEKCAWVRQPVTQLIAAATTFSAAMGAGYLGPTRAVSPLISLILAPPAGGKDASQSMAQIFMEANGMGERLSAADWGSASGLETELSECNERFAVHDEFATTLESLGHPACPPYRAKIMQIIRTIYSGKSWAGTALKDSSERKIIDKPRLAIFASAQPHSFWNVLSPKTINDGTMSRFLVITSYTQGGRRRPGERVEAFKDSMPPLLKEFTQAALADRRHAEGSPDAIAKTPIGERIIDWKDLEAETMFCDMADEYAARSEKFYLGGEPLAAALVGRSAERALRLAAVYAWSESLTPAVSREALEWAKVIVDASDAGALASVCDIMPQNAAQSMPRMISTYMRHISTAGKDGMPAGILQSKTRYGMRAHADIIKSLVASGHVCVKHGKRGGQYYHWLGGRVEEDPVEDQENVA